MNEMNENEWGCRRLAADPVYLEKQVQLTFGANSDPAGSVRLSIRKTKGNRCKIVQHEWDQLNLKNAGPVLAATDGVTCHWGESGMWLPCPAVDPLTSVAPTTPQTHYEAGRVVEQTAKPDGEAAPQHVAVLCHTHQQQQPIISAEQACSAITRTGVTFSLPQRS